MPSEMELEVFRAGNYGAKGSYSEADLEQIAKDYDPQLHEAPVTLDHEQQGPALGWVQSLRAMGKTLLARLAGLDTGFLEKLKSGAYKKTQHRTLQNAGNPAALSARTQFSRRSIARSKGNGRPAVQRKQR